MIKPRSSCSTSGQSIHYNMAPEKDNITSWPAERVSPFFGSQLSMKEKLHLMKKINFVAPLFEVDAFKFNSRS